MTSRSRIHKFFLTFASSNLKRSSNRLVRQATKLACFDHVLARDESDLDPVFVERFKQQLNFRTRGFGYWCWKPHIILQTLHMMRDGDLLLYLDVGCHLNARGLWRLDQYFERALASPTGVLGFQAVPPEPPFPHDGRPLPDQPDGDWTKGDLLDHFEVRHRTDIVDTPTVRSGMIFFRKCRAAERLVERWRSVFEHDFSLVDDSPSRSPDLPGFVENRHDQAVFSLIGKLAGIDSISDCETWYLPRWAKRSPALGSPPTGMPSGTILFTPEGTRNTAPTSF